jgi:hypothetical protein
MFESRDSSADIVDAAVNALLDIDELQNHEISARTATI